MWVRAWSDRDDSSGSSSSSHREAQKWTGLGKIVEEGRERATINSCTLLLCYVIIQHNNCRVAVPRQRSSNNGMQIYKRFQPTKPKKRAKRRTGFVSSSTLHLSLFPVV